MWWCSWMIRRYHDVLCCAALCPLCCAVLCCTMAAVLRLLC